MNSTKIIYIFWIFVFLFFTNINRTLAKDKNGLTDTLQRFVGVPNIEWVSNQDSTNYEDPSTYRVEISMNSNFTEIVDCDTVYSSRYVTDKPLLPGHYYWKVRGLNSIYGVEGAFIIDSYDEVLTVPFDSLLSNHLTVVRNIVDSAIVLANTGKVIKVVFQPGKYKFLTSDSHVINILNSSNIHLDGNGSSVDILKNNVGFTNIRNCSNILISGFSIDYTQERTYLHGYVIGRDPIANRVEVELEPSSPTYDDSYVLNGLAHMSLIDPLINGRLKTGAPSFFRINKDSISFLGGRSFSLKLSSPLSSSMQVGDRFVDFLRTGVQSLMYTQDSDNVAFYDIVTFSSPGGHFTAISCDNYSVLHCHLKLKEGRWFGGNADGIHARSLRTGPWVEGSSMTAIGDDGIALYSRPMRGVDSSNGDTGDTLRLRTEYFDLVVGDLISLFDPTTGTIFLETEVLDVNVLSGYREIVMSDTLPRPLRSGTGILTDDQIWNRSKSNGDFVIRDCNFENIRRYGSVFRSAGGVIESNTYKGTSSSAIISLNETQYPNGLFSSDVTIVDNSFADFNFAAQSFGAISFFFYGNGNIVPQSYGSRNILVRDNRALDNNAKVFVAQKVKNILIKDLFVEGLLIDPGNISQVQLNNVLNINFE